MIKRYSQYNSKCKIKELSPVEFELCSRLAKQVRYGGNPELKMHPGDFSLTPPSGARPGKSLCDAVNIFSKKIALQHLQSGLRRGLISERFHGDWPQNIWSVTENGFPLEAQLENQETGAYHGYPMPESDPLASEIIRLWTTLNDPI